MSLNPHIFQQYHHRYLITAVNVHTFLSGQTVLLIEQFVQLTVLSFSSYLIKQDAEVVTACHWLIVSHSDKQDKQSARVWVEFL